MLVTLIALVAFVLGVGAALLVQKRRVTRVVVRLHGAWFAGPVTARPGSLGTTILVVDPDGLRLLRISGEVKSTWSWPQVRAVRAQAIRYRAALQWPGAVIDLDARWEPTLSVIFLPAIGFGVSASRAQRAVEAIDRGIRTHRSEVGPDQTA